VPEQVAVGKVKEAFDEDDKLVDTEVAQRVAELAQSVVKASIMLRDNKQ
jgi:hypothetical protein